ncbi:MAG: YfcE family phosphodiesterase [Lachnospiraceae bacterium]|nr:YfcE family phosphodiesterase [Lachnospiraceae bacterium]
MQNNTTKLLLLADNHGSANHMYSALLNEQPVDAILHAGDANLHLEDYLAVYLKHGGRLYAVQGNTDEEAYPKQLVINVPIGPEETSVCRILMVHGHDHGVYGSMDRLYYAAKENGASVVVFAHTHFPVVFMEGDVLFINPGSLEKPRQENRLPSYAVLTITDDENITEKNAEIMYLE